MGWTDLFKSQKKDGSASTSAVQWFGKVPNYGDYCASRRDLDWVVEFNEWVLSGFEVFHGQQSRERRRVGRLCDGWCFLRLPKSQMCVAGLVQDYGGDLRGRPFPLFFYCGLDPADWPAINSGRVRLLTDIVSRLDRLHLEVPRFLNSPGRFEHTFGDRAIDLTGSANQQSDDGWEAEADAIPMIDWFKAAYPAAKEDQSLEAFFTAVTELGGRLGNLTRRDGGPTLRFPLAPGISSTAQVAGWLRWLEARMNLDEWLVSLIVVDYRPRRGGTMSVIAREPVKDDFLLFAPFIAASPYVDDLVRLAPNPAHQPAEPQKLPATDGVDNLLSGTWRQFAESVPPGS